MIQSLSPSGTRRLRGVVVKSGAVRYRRDLRATESAPNITPDDAPTETGRTTTPQNGNADGSPALSAAPAAQSVGADVSLDGKRIMICEDEGVTQLQLRRALSRAGLDVIGVAINGRQGLEIALRERPDIVLMDIHMPIMDGLEAARRILETFSVCVVMLTAFSDEEYLEKAQSIGTSGYILKPVTSDTLLPQLRRGYAAFLNRS